MLAKEYQKVEQYDEPSAILEKLSEKKSEMSASERGFLCGLIKKYCPKKIVEVGVAAGGTTSVILSCINELKLECQMYSVDISENYYRGGYKQTGYLVEEVKKQEIATAHHTFLLGKTLPERIEEIGADIDFLILDTMHVLPGEILDFIVAFPYLKKDAIVVLHDIGLQFRAEYRRMIATGILFQTVVADKFWNNQGVYPNIAGFQITEDTGKYMRDMFLSLTLPWQYTLPGKTSERI